MRLQFKEIKLRHHTWYTGIISNISLDEKKGRLYIFVYLDLHREEAFLKSLPLSKSLSGSLALFFEELDVMLDDNSVELDDLHHAKVKVTLEQGKKGQWFIEKMKLIEPIYEDESEDEEEEE